MTNVHHARPRHVMMAGIAGIITWSVGCFLIVALAAEPVTKSPTLPTTYTVQRGDTLSQIAEHFYDDARQLEPILQANPKLIERPGYLAAGWVITIPALGPDADAAVPHVAATAEPEDATERPRPAPTAPLAKRSTERLTLVTSNAYPPFVGEDSAPTRHAHGRGPYRI